MSDAAASHFEATEKPAAETGGRAITLSITLHPNGQLELSGPLQNKILTNGLLGAAQQELFRIHLMEELKSRAARENGGSMGGFLKKMGRG